MLKKSRFFVGIALMVQAVTLTVFFILFMFKKKSIAAALLAVAALEGATGAYLLYQIQEEEEADLFDPADYLYNGDDFEFDFDDDDVTAELARDDDDAPMAEPYTIKREDDVSEDEFKNR